MFTFTPLLGAQSTSRASQSILELDGGVKVLIDVGWDESFDANLLLEVEKQTTSLSFVLLTHATLSHLGAYAHCCKHVAHFTQIPVYATSPVIAFGRTLLQDLYSSNPLAATFIPSSTSDESQTASGKQTNILRQAPTAEEISKYFSVINPLKYSQPLQPAPSQFSGPLEGLTLTAFNSGHTLGGTIWHILHGMESIVYAVDWNQARENVIAGAAWFGGVGGAEVIEQLRKPTALVCSSVRGDKIGPPGGVKARDAALLGHIRSCLSRGGMVLIPTDSGARVLELAWILEKAWYESSKTALFKDSRVYIASRSGNATLRHARSLLEWMDDRIVREFEGDEEAAAARTHRRNGSRQANGVSKPSRPFQFRYVKIIERRAQLERALKGEGPRVILSSDLSLDWGYSPDILEKVSQDPANLVLLTERLSSTRSTSPSSALWNLFENRPNGVALEKSTENEQIEQVHGGSGSFIIQITERAPLDDHEAQQYQQYIAAQHQMQSSLAVDNEDAANAADDNIDDATSSSSEESDDEHQGRALNVSAAIGHAGRGKVTLTDEDLGVNILIRKKGVFDYDVRNKRGRNAVFPYTHSRRRGDEFGDLIKPEDFLREEEKEEQDASGGAKLGDLIGQKRKWGDGSKQAEQPDKKRQAKAKDIASASKMDADSDFESEESDEGEPEIEGSQSPSKVQYSEKAVTFNARLAFVDFAGLHDQRSLQMLIPLIGPKKLVLTGGSSEETMALASDCRELLGIKFAGAEDEPLTEIFTPAVGDTVDASVDTNAWIVKLSRNLAKKLHWQQVKNVGVLTLQGELRAEATTVDIQDPAAKKLKMGEKAIESTSIPTADELVPILDTLPASIAASTRSVAQPIHVGDMRLADLRRIMNANGHSAEFRGEGTLLVDGIIGVKKLASGRITVEGVPVNTVAQMTTRTSDSFTRVKQQIYQGLAVVATG